MSEQQPKRGRKNIVHENCKPPEGNPKGFLKTICYAYLFCF